MAVGIKKFTMEYLVPKIKKNLKERFDAKQKAFKSIDEKGKGLSLQTRSEIKKSFSGKASKIFDDASKKRKEFKKGSSKGKIPTTPKEKSLAKLAPPKDRITFGDVIAGRTKGKRMQAREGTLPLTKRNIKEGKPGKIKELPFGNMSEEKRKLKSQRKP